MKGIDISNNNGNVTFSMVAKSGVECIYMKATEGKTFVDPKLETFYEQALKYGFKIGFYHFLVGTSSPEDQARAFYAQIKDKTSHLKPCLDIEVNNGFDPEDYAERFIKTFESLSDMELCIYTSPYFADDFLNTFLSNYSLWVAHYYVQTPKSTKIWGNTYAGHQYTDKGNVSGVTGVVDMNTFNEDILLSTCQKGKWVKEKTEWKYYIDSENYLSNCWKFIEDEWYYFNEHGFALSNEWLEFNGKWYFLKHDCKMAKSEWILTNSNWFYIHEDGSMAIGWIKYKEDWYYLDKNGHMVTGWLDDNGKRYFLNDNGSMRTGWIDTDGNWYYLNPNGEMARNVIIDNWHINNKGIAIKIEQ